LVLLNAVISSITVYWASITKIPKGILHKIRKICFHFLWAGNIEKRSYPLVKWSTLSMPKALGGWGIKNLIWFSKSLVAKSLWRLLHNEMLWGKVLSSKCLQGKTFIDWIKMLEMLYTPRIFFLIFLCLLVISEDLIFFRNLSYILREYSLQFRVSYT
jgi:hypothetical protein